MKKNRVIGLGWALGLLLVSVVGSSIVFAGEEQPTVISNKEAIDCVYPTDTK